MRLSFLAYLALVCLLAACRPLPPPADAVAEPSATQLAAPTTATFDLCQTIRAGEENLLCSPFSISPALATIYAGAGGETARQMADTLHFTLPQERLHAAFNALNIDRVHIGDVRHKNCIRVSRSAVREFRRGSATPERGLAWHLTCLALHFRKV